MNGPTRLSASGSPLTRQLLLAGRAERPRSDAKVEAVAAAVLITSGHASFVFSLRRAWLGWLAVGLGLIGAGAVVSVALRSPRQLSVEEVMVDRADATFDVRPRVPDGFVADQARPLVVVAPTAEPRTATSAPNLAPARPTELSLVRRARIELAKSDPASALETLDEHMRFYPTGTLREEAAALRVEALARSGDDKAARAAAARFARTYPESPYSERVRSIAAGLPH